MNSDQSPLFTSLESKIFTENKGKIYIGKEEIKPKMKEILKSQAQIFQTSHLYEILRATIINESYDIALRQSKDFDEVKFAKALYHWQYVLDNLLSMLTK
jgi:hypothetical protein